MKPPTIPNDRPGTRRHDPATGVVAIRVPRGSAPGRWFVTRSGLESFYTNDRQRLIASWPATPNGRVEDLDEDQP